MTMRGKRKELSCKDRFTHASFTNSRSFSGRIQLEVVKGVHQDRKSLYGNALGIRDNPRIALGIRDNPRTTTLTTAVDS
jgi:hypothetical protein